MTSRTPNLCYRASPRQGFKAISYHIIYWNRGIFLSSGQQNRLPRRHVIRATTQAIRENILLTREILKLHPRLKLTQKGLPPGLTRRQWCRLSEVIHQRFVVSEESELTAKNIGTEGPQAINYSQQLSVCGTVIHFSWVQLPTMIGHRPPHIFHTS